MARATIGLYPGLTPHLLAANEDRSFLVHFQRRHAVFVEGAVSNGVYVILAGKVKIVRHSRDDREKIVALLGPGELFGELSAVDPGPRSSAAIAVTEVHAALIDQDALRSSIADWPEIAEQMLRALARRIRVANNDIAAAVFNDVPGRVARQLLMLSQKFGVDEDNRITVNHGLTQSELAQLMGVSREAVNKTLSDFVARGWIRVGVKSVDIWDSERLALRAAW